VKSTAAHHRVVLVSQDHPVVSTSTGSGTTNRKLEKAEGIAYGLIRAPASRRLSPTPSCERMT
jgi:hypothetical protein